MTLVRGTATLFKREVTSLMGSSEISDFFWPLLPGQKKSDISLDPINEVTSLLKSVAVPRTRVMYTPTLARGLNYYTGMIMEVAIDGYEAGSVGGGGGYDGILGLFSG